jgi:poly(3-hydroxybutyrate) depolymerase
MNDVGESRGFYVLYPEQPSSENSNKCWNWFETADQSRGGEPKVIADMVNKVICPNVLSLSVFWC